MTPGHYRAIPYVELDEKEILHHQSSSTGLCKLFDIVPHAREAGCLMISLLPAREKLSKILRAKVGCKVYPDDKKKFYMAGRDGNWVTSDALPAVFDEFAGQSLNAIFSVTDTRIEAVSFATAGAVVDLVKLEEDCYNKLAQVYYERMRMMRPFFESPVLIKYGKRKIPAKTFNRRRVLTSKPIISCTFPVNLCLVNPRFELIMQTYGQGDGITEMWCYGKAHQGTVTLQHKETHGQGAMNIFVGKGFCGWHLTRPSDYGSVRKLYQEKAISSGYKVGKNDFFFKTSAPSTKFLLESGIDVYYAMQTDACLILTLPNCLHSVFNYASGLALARNFHCVEFYQNLPREIVEYQEDLQLGEAFEHNQNIMIRLRARMVASDPEFIRRETEWLNENWNITSVSVKPKYRHLDIITLDNPFPNDMTTSLSIEHLTAPPPIDVIFTEDVYPPQAETSVLATDPETLVFRCDVCSKEYSTKLQLSFHTVKAHDWFRCAVCDIDIQRVNYKEHLTTKKHNRNKKQKMSGVYSAVVVKPSHGKIVGVKQVTL